MPFEMREQQGVYNMEKKIFGAAVRGLRPVEAPYPVNLPLVDPRDPFSLKPGSLTDLSISSKPSDLGFPPSLNNAIAGAQAAATQFSKEKKGDARVDSEAETPISSRTRNKLMGKGRNKEKFPHET